MNSRRLYGILFLVLFSSPLNSQVFNDRSTPEITAGDILYHIVFLASDELKGRKAGTEEGRLAAAYIANEFERYGLEPAGNDSSFFQVFEFISGVAATERNRLVVQTGEHRYSYTLNEDFTPLGFSASGTVNGDVVFAGFGISAPDEEYDDYRGIDVKGKIAVAFMGVPDSGGAGSPYEKYAPVRFKAMTAREKGAAALVLSYGYAGGEIDELPALTYDNAGGDSGIPVIHIRRNVLATLFSGTGTTAKSREESITGSGRPASMLLENTRITIVADIERERDRTQNVLGFLAGAGSGTDERLIIIGAHYDHLGLGGPGSMAPSRTGEVHNGADDNASGVAGMLELAQKLSRPEHRLGHPVLFIAFGAEELGTLGSNYYVNHPVFPLEKTGVMFNFDMIGRLQENILILNGAGTSPVWHTLAEEVNREYSFELKYSEGGLGGSDHTPFYSHQIPVLFFFTGTHADYHKPSDDYQLIDSAGEARIVRFAEDIIKNVDQREQIAYTRVQEAEGGRTSRNFRVTLRIVPDFTASESAGMKIADVVDGGPAAKAGIRAGDTIIRMHNKDVANIYDYMYLLEELKPGDTVDVVVRRGGRELTFKVTLNKSMRRPE